MEYAKSSWLLEYTSIADGVIKMAVKQDPRNGRWVFEFMINRKRYHRSVPEAKNKKDAEKAEAVFKGELLQGRYNLAENKKYKKLNELIQVYLEYSIQNKASSKLDEYTTRTFLDFVGDKTIDEITPALIEKWKKYRSNCKVKTTTSKGLKELDRLVSKSSVNREIRSLSKMFSIAVDNDWLEYNPFFKVKKFKEENKLERHLLPDEEKILMKSAEGTFIKPILICLLRTGMRPIEVKQLKWSCVHFEEGYIDVLKTKSGNPRKIPISNNLKQELEKLTRLSDYVFTNPKTLKPYVNIRDKFMDLCEENKIADIRLYDLRHTAATRMNATTGDIVVVKDILGHSSLNVTQRYAHPVPERKKVAVEGLDNYS